MKAILFLCALVSVGASVPAKRATPKPFTVAMCGQVQPYASLDYVVWCVTNATKANPKCYVGHEKNHPRDVGVPAYLEIYDCAWHHGHDPRDELWVK